MARPAPLSGPASKNFQPRPTKLNPPNPERPEFFFERDDGSLFGRTPPVRAKPGPGPRPSPKWDTPRPRNGTPIRAASRCPESATSGVPVLPRHIVGTPPCPSTATVGRGVPDGGHPLSPKWDMSGIRARSIPPDPGPAAAPDPGPAAAPPAPPIRARPCPAAAPDPGPRQRPDSAAPRPPIRAMGEPASGARSGPAESPLPLRAIPFYGEKIPPRRWPPIRARPNEISRIDLAPLDI